MLAWEGVRPDLAQQMLRRESTRGLADARTALGEAAPVDTQRPVSAESTVPGGPVGGQTRVTLRNEHLQYIITW